MVCFRDLLKYLSLLLLLASLAGCGADSDCLDPDDFGFTVLDVSSRYEDSELFGSRDDQIAPWRDHNLRLSGKALVITVKNWSNGTHLNNKRQLSAWCPWYGNKDYKDVLSPYCARLPGCIYRRGEMCTNPEITNVPCVMKQGVGLYAYLAKNTSGDPNAQQSTMEAPPAASGVTVHVGQTGTGYTFYDIFTGDVMNSPTAGALNQLSTYGGIVYDYDGQRGIRSSRVNYANGKLYFKIVDTYYKDNNGKYRVTIRSGLKQPGEDIFGRIRTLVMERLFGTTSSSGTQFERTGVVRSIYENIVQERGFINAVRAVLILYVTITGLLFVMGSIQMTNSEIVERVLKIAIISILIGPNSWDFFNNYLFIWMYKGSEFIVDMYSSAAGAGPGDSTLLAFLTSPQIMAKLAAMLFVNWMGFFFIICYFLMLIFLTFVMFNATLIYMSAFIMIGLLIALAPVFIVFFLFESTKSFFENWLKQMIGYAIQIIIISAGILFMGLIIRTEIYNNMGYGVCLRQFPDMNTGSSPLSSLIAGSSVDDGNVTSIFSWWFPVIDSNVTSADRRNILVPKPHYRTTSSATHSQTLQVASRTSSNFCQAYQCTDSRYPDLPFLDPDNDYEARIMRILRDKNKINMWGLFTLIVCCYLLFHFNETTVSIAKFLSSTTGNLGDNTVAAKGAFSRITNDIISYGDRKLGLSKRKRSIEKRIHDSWTRNVTNNLKSYASRTHYARLERQAVKGDGLITGGINHASSDILKQVSSKYGLRQADAREYQNNKKQYKEYLEQLSMESANKKALLKALDKGNLNDFDELVKKHDLSTKEKVALAHMSKAKSKEMRFKKAYVDAYRDIMDQRKENVAAKSRKRQMRAFKADRNIAAFSNLKRYLTGNLLTSEADEILYNDTNLMTTNERIAQNEARLEAKARKKMLNAMTVKAGQDVQRLDYLAERRNEIASGDLDAFHLNSAKYEMKNLDNLIKAAIEDNLREALIEGEYDESGNQVGIIKGDTYIRSEMNDDEFDKMISDVRTKGNEVMQNDDYIDNADLYMDTEGAEAELETRKSHYQSAIEKEVSRLNDVRFSEADEPASIQSKFKDWSGGSGGSDSSGGDSDGGGSGGSGGGIGPVR